MTRRTVVAFATALTALSFAACSDATDPPGAQPDFQSEPQSQLHFLTPNSGAPGLISDTVQFYAVPGQDRSGALYYTDSTQYLNFDVPANALPTGDSVLITIAIADSSQMIVSFEPSGLQFVNGHPAMLTLSFAHADSSVSGANEVKLSLWGQEHPGQNWHKVPSNVDKKAMTVTGRIDGFTVYATAY